MQNTAEPCKVKISAVTRRLDATTRTVTAVKLKRGQIKTTMTAARQALHKRDGTCLMLQTQSRMALAVPW